MKILMVEPGRIPHEAEIEPGLESLQAAVGGDIQAVYPYDDPVALICNEEGKLMGLPLNRALTNDTGNVYDIIAGKFLIVGLGEESFASLSDDLIKKYTEQFLCPEKFVRIAGKYLAVKQPVPQEEIERQQKETAARKETSTQLASDLERFFRENSDAYTGMDREPQEETDRMAAELLSGRTDAIRMRLASVEQDGHLGEEIRPLLDRVSSYEKEYGISAYSVYQLSLSDSTDDLRFMSYDWVQSRGLSVDRDNYLMVYTAQRDPGSSLEDIYRDLNINRPADFKGHSLSVSDVVVLHEGWTSAAYYVDSIGFKELPGFLGEPGQPEAKRGESVREQLDSAKKQIPQAEPKAPDRKKEPERG